MQTTNPGSIRFGQVFRWVGILLLFLLPAGFVAVVLMPNNWLRGLAGDKGSALIGREFAIDGMAGVDAQLDLRGDNLADLFYLTGIPLPPTPPYQLIGHLQKQNGIWEFHHY
jgi:uncharacterized protein involved in outer membrane biogenesis